MSAYALEAEQVRMLIRRGWELDAAKDYWTHPKHTNQGLRVMFSFDQVLKIEGLE